MAERERDWPTSQALQESGTLASNFIDVAQGRLKQFNSARNVNWENGRLNKAELAKVKEIEAIAADLIHKVEALYDGYV